MIVFHLHVFVFLFTFLVRFLVCLFLGEAMQIYRALSFQECYGPYKLVLFGAGAD